MRLWRKLNVYVFVMTTISTWMNGNLLESTCKCLQTCMASDQPHWLVSGIQYVCQSRNISKGCEGREVSGRYSIIMHYPFLSTQPFLFQSSFNTTSQKLCKWILPPYFSSCPLQIAGPKGAGVQLAPPPPPPVPEVHFFLLTNNLKQSDLIIFFESYSLENSERVNKPHAFRKTCFHLYVSALKRGVWYAYKAFTPC